MIRLLLLYFTMFICGLGFANSGLAASEKIKVNKKPLEEVVSLIAQHSDYKIHLIGKHNSEKISGVFYLSDIETTIRRLFKKYDTFIEFDDEKRNIYVKFPDAGPVNTYVGSQNYLSEIDRIDPDTGLTYAEIIANRERDRKIRLERMSDPNEIDPVTGISYVQQIKTKKIEKEIAIQRTSNPDNIDPTTELSYGEREAIKQKDLEKRIARQSDPNEVDPTIGISYIEREALKKQEREERAIRQNDPNEIDPTIGISYVEQAERRKMEQRN